MPNNRIATLRREHGMNQKELGEKLGVAQTTVSAWETGKTEPDGAAMGKMSNLFRVSIGYLMGYEPESRTRGLSQEDYDIMVMEALEAREQRRFERMAEKAEMENEVDEETLAEIFHEEDMKAWKEAGRPDTLEGFLAGQLIDNQPSAMRKWLYQMLQELVKGPKA